MKLITTKVINIISVMSAGILIALATVGTIHGIDVGILTRDVAAIAGVHPFVGILSNLGILLWCVTAAICLFAAIAIDGKAPKSIYGFLLSSALVSSWLLFDDLFLFHEYLARQYLDLSERTVFIALGITIFAYLVIFRNTILKSNHPFLLITALGFLTASVFVDQAFDETLPLANWTYFFEDSLKWIGISCWCSFYVTTAYQFLLNSFSGESV